MIRQKTRRRRFAQRGFMSVIMAGICLILTLMLTATILISGMVKQRVEQQAQADAVAMARGIIAKEQGLTAICNHPGLQRLMDGNSPRLTEVDCEAAVRNERPDGTTGLQFRANVDGDVSADTPVFGPNQRWRLDSTGTAEVEENLFEDVELRFPKLALVLDYSGSMQCSFDANCNQYNFERIDALRDSVTGLLALGLRVDYGMVAFSTGVLDAVPVARGQEARIRDRVSANDPDGWTNYAAALDRATHELTQTENHGWYVLFVTDGEPTRPGSHDQAVAAAQAAANRARHQDVTIFTLNVTAVARARQTLISLGGSRHDAGDPAYYFEARNAAELLAQFRDIVASILCSIGPLNPPPDDPHDVHVFLQEGGGEVMLERRVDLVNNANELAFNYIQVENKIRLTERACNAVLERGADVAVRYGRVHLID